MRDIRFRAKIIDVDKWVYGGYAYEYRDDSHMIFINEFVAYNAGFKPKREDYVLNCYEVIPETIGQFTGIKDRNGVDIYEGDIVYHRVFGKRRISWGSDAGNNLFKDMACFMFNGTIAFLSEDDTPDIRVIGNIYDNEEHWGM